MSKEIDDQLTLDQCVISNDESQKKDKILYSRDFLLSLSELDTCKALPSGFDLSVLREFNDAFNNLQSWKRVPGNFSLQSFRCGENGSPPTGEDSSNYSRGIHGRWDSRSCGQVDEDIIPRSDRDAENFGKRYVYQSRRSWKIPEHDGLLGSGSSARPSGYSDAPKARANDHFQLKRSSEPYHPPRPYKAHNSFKEAKDSYNDETFGLSNFTSHDKSVEERKRRDSFELMRKEQKDLIEKQKLDPNQAKGKLLSDISFLMKENENNEILNIMDVQKVLDESHIERGPPEVLGKSSSKVIASRPLVPPGFTSGVVGRDFETKTSCKSLMEEVVDNIKIPDDTEDDLRIDLTSIPIKHLSPNMGCSIQQFREDILKSSTIEINAMNDGSYKTDVDPFDTVEDSKTLTLDAEKGLGHKFVNKLVHKEPSTSTSVVENSFGTDLAINDSGISSLIQNYNMEEDVMWIPTTTKSSRLSHWFLEEENKAVGDCSSSRPDNLFSLIAGGDDNHGTSASNVESAEQVKPAFPLEISYNIGSPLASDVSLSSTVEMSEFNCNKPVGVSAVLRCEDLEQSILSEINENIIHLNPSIQDLGTHQQPRVCNDDNASRHLLSLLQKGESLQGFSPPSGLEKEECHVAKNLENVDIPETSTPTLETIFGSAFMKELHDSVGSARVDPMLGFDDAVKAGDPMYLRAEVGSKPNEIPLPREGNLIGMGDPLVSSVSEKLGSLNALKENHGHILHGQANLPLQRSLSPYDLLDLEIHRPQSNHGGAFLHPFEAHAVQPNPQFMTHASNRIHIPENMIHPHFNGLSGFDPRIQYAPFHQTQMAVRFGNEEWQGLCGINPLRPQASDFMRDSGIMHGFPYGHQNPPFGASRMPFPGGEKVDSVQRLVGMEHLMNTFPASEAGGGLYSDGLETSFRYNR